MYRYKNCNITDFFKALTQPLPSKRQCEETDLELTNDATRKRRSASPHTLTDHILDGPPFPPPRENPSELSEISVSSKFTSLFSDASIESPVPVSPRAPQMSECEELPFKSAAEGSTSTGQHPEDKMADETIIVDRSLVMGRILSPLESVLTSSQRMSRTGEAVIRNSDGETDSDESFEDIDNLLARGKPSQKSSPPTEIDNARPTPRDRLRPRANVKAKDTSTSIGASTKPKYKFSLASLVAQRERNNAAEAGVARARARVELLERNRANLEAKLSQGTSHDNLDQSFLKSVMEGQGDNDSIDKLLGAIRRTEALRQKKSWFFFNRSGSPVELSEFPAKKDSHDWSIAIPTRKCQRTIFASGYTEEVALTSDLPEEILEWIFDYSSTEPVAALREAYLATLTNSGRCFKPFLTPARIDSLFRRLGAYDSALDTRYPVVATMQTTKKDGDLLLQWSSIHHALNIVGNLAEWMDSDTRVHALTILFRLTLDSTAFRDGRLMIVFGHVFENLVNSMQPESVENEILVVLTAIYSQLEDAELQLQMVNNMPSTSTRLCLMRRRLALAFFFAKSDYLEKPTHNLVRFSTMRKRLRRPELAINNNTDYVRLSATISLLDIGLDDGDPPERGLEQDEREFDKNVDMLSNMMDAINRGISDGGASHMTRTEAKNTIMSFNSRLAYVVRIKPRPKKDLLGDSTENPAQLAQSAIFLKKFLGGDKEKGGNRTVMLE